MSACTIINSVLFHEYGIKSESTVINNNFVVSWGRKSKSNLFWLIRFVYFLRKEFFKRYGTLHRLTLDLKELYSKFKTKNFPDEFFKLEIPDKYNLGNCYEDNLLNYYYIEKVKTKDFIKGRIPERYKELIDINILYVGYLKDLDLIVRFIDDENSCRLQKYDKNWYDLLCLNKSDESYKVIRSILTNET